MSRAIAFIVSLLPSADLPLPVRFGIGAVVIFTWWLIVGATIFLAPILLRDLIALFREAFRPEPPAKVVNIDERRRRLELDAAVGRRAS